MYQVQLVLKTKFGEFVGKQAFLNQEAFDTLIKMSKSFYNSSGFELTCEDGSFVVFPPDIVRESILVINNKVINRDEDKNINDNVHE